MLAGTTASIRSASVPNPSIESISCSSATEGPMCRRVKASASSRLASVALSDDGGAVSGMVIPLRFGDLLVGSGIEQRIDCRNGSHIDLFGADDKRKADRGAGNDAVRCIFDEAGAEGVAISLCAGEEVAYLRDIERIIRMKIEMVAHDLPDLTPEQLKAAEERRQPHGHRHGPSGWHRGAAPQPFDR